MVSRGPAAGAVVGGLLTYLLTFSPLFATAGTIVGFLLVDAGLWALFWDQRASGQFDAAFAHDPLAYEPRRYVANDAALSEERPGLNSAVDWTCIVRISRKDGLIVVWLTKLDGWPIPERCFKSAEQADAFHALLQSRAVNALKD